MYAELVDHPGLQAWARGTLAMIAYWARLPRQAITQVEAGLDGALDGAARTRRATLPEPPSGPEPLST